MNRIVDHPILGPLADAEVVHIIVDGVALTARKGEMIAAALIANGKNTFRRTVKRDEPRGIYCGIGRCTDCVMTVNGIPNVRTCVTEVAEGMVIETQLGSGEWQ
ncbi:MAG TPA: (2Fe-2S)-binding protein [Sphaerochaeta sp.]|nr:(2Fe-2S)-binding protein [Sphaerochaeta sp.]